MFTRVQRDSSPCSIGLFMFSRRVFTRSFTFVHPGEPLVHPPRGAYKAPGVNKLQPQICEHLPVPARSAPPGVEQGFSGALGLSFPGSDGAGRFAPEGFLAAFRITPNTLEVPPHRVLFRRWASVKKTHQH
jgi:hypothetical protein